MGWWVLILASIQKPTIKKMKKNSKKFSVVVILMQSDPWWWWWCTFVAAQLQGLVVQSTDWSWTLFQTACSSSMRKNYLLQVNLQWNNSGAMTLGAWGKNSCPEFAAMQHWGYRDMGAFQEEKNSFKVCNGIHHCQRNERTLGAWFQEEKNSQSLLQCNSGRTLGCCCCCWSRFRV